MHSLSWLPLLKIDKLVPCVCLCLFRDELVVSLKDVTLLYSTPINPHNLDVMKITPQTSRREEGKGWIMLLQTPNDEGQ